ncbi:hypothetical protein [Marinilactibacillus psychrotolerans]|uniref:hypothetical protein n=1 Tax=Marinilactibacillus psychrotolerans TaxID=191770 RepID=UPI0038176934
MLNFKNCDYEYIISDLIHDTFYIESSHRGKIQKIRQYSEVLVRKIIDKDSNSKLTLGDQETQRELKKKNINLFNTVEKIRVIGNEATHTRYIKNFTDEELDKTIDALFDLYAFLFIDYFHSFPIGKDTEPEILTDFSLLPPVIRFKTLDYLYKENLKTCKIINNIYFYDKYCLAIIKYKGKEAAFEWLKKNKKILEEIIYPSYEERQALIEEVGINILNSTMITLSINGYELLLDKIDKVGNQIIENGKLYESFEEAVEYYRLYKSDSVSKEINELHSIIDFVYLGRISSKNIQIK